MKRLALWAASAAALMALPIIFGERIVVDEWKTAAIAAVVIGFINMTIGPILNFFTLPLKWLTFGISTLFINGLLIWGASSVVPGFDIDKFFPTAILAAAIYSLATGVAAKILLDD